MFKNEDDFAKIVENLKIDSRPKPDHRQELRGRMLCAFEDLRTSRQRSETSEPTYWRIITSKVAKVAIAAGIVLMVIAAWQVSFESKASAAGATEVLGQAMRAAYGLQSVHIKARVHTFLTSSVVRTGSDRNYVAIEMWKQFEDPVKWRVEGPQRTIVMDGNSTMMLVKPNHVLQEGPKAEFWAWMGTLVNVDKILGNELGMVQNQDWQADLAKVTGSNGRSKLVVTIEVQAQGDSAGDWMDNKAITYCDHRRVYRFDAKTKLLEDLQVYIHADQGDMLAFEITQINYNCHIDPSLFTLALPEDVIWYGQPPVLANNEQYQQMSPGQVVRAFLQACGDEDWNEAAKFWPASELSQWPKDKLSGLEIVTVGDPFKSGAYPGWFVPYKIKLESGIIQEWNIAVRNDNPAKRYVVDDGI